MAGMVWANLVFAVGGSAASFPAATIQANLLLFLGGAIQAYSAEHQNRFRFFCVFVFDFNESGL